MVWNDKDSINTVQFIGSKINQEKVNKVCYCIGPQHGEPVCPCEMSQVFERDGRWIQKEIDLGPVK